mmetsp:Transcript_41973/g.110889  ORF Transcript_41973/g.110889 Transcript_41973/m.110889 type:complete len:258 (+) Transcript_41973:322-1095(+)
MSSPASKMSEMLKEPVEMSTLRMEQRMPSTVTSTRPSVVSTTFASRTWPSSTLLASSFVATLRWLKTRAKSEGRKAWVPKSSRLADWISTRSGRPTMEVSPTLSARKAFGTRPSRPLLVCTMAPNGLRLRTMTSWISSVPSSARRMPSISAQADSCWSSTTDRIIWVELGSPGIMEMPLVLTTLASISSPRLNTSEAEATGERLHCFVGMKAQVLAPISTNAPSSFRPAILPDTMSPSCGISQFSKVLPAVSCTKSS